MGRCRKSFEEQLGILDGQIAKAQEKLDVLISQKESVLARKREEEIGELYQILKDYQLSVQDVLDIVQSQTVEEEPA